MKMKSDNNWHKPTEKEKLDVVNEHYSLPKHKRKRLDWWDKIKIAVYEHEAIQDVDFEIIEPKLLPEAKTNSKNK